jgi:hypothetical protein
MKVSRLSTIVLGGCLLFSAGAFAGNTTKKSIHLYENVTVEGTQLAPGDYKVEWSGPGPDVKISFLKGKETVATAPAHIESANSSNLQDGYSLKVAKDGSQAVSDIFFAGEKFDLKLDQGSAADSPQSPTSSGTN